MRLAMCWMLLALSLVAETRIVSTAPSFTETAFALGLGADVVAVSTYCHYPEAANKLPRIGSYLKPNIEAIARLRPTVVLAHNEQPVIRQQLEKLGLNVLGLTNTNLNDVFGSIETLGKALNVEPRAKTLTAQLRGRLEALRRARQGQSVRSILFIVGRTPGRLEGMIAVGKGSYLNELMAAAGTRNVLGDSAVAYPRISMETLIRLNPDVIVDMGDMAETVGVTEQHKREVTTLWRNQEGLRAVKEQRLYVVASDIFVVPGPRIVDAAEAFARMAEGKYSQ